MNRTIYQNLFAVLTLAILCFSGAASITAQTSAFTYQGRLTDTSAAANGFYDMQFRVYDSPTVGQGTTSGVAVTVTNVQVADGIFTVKIDPQVTPFVGGNLRYLEIRVRPAGSGNGYTTLAPRQEITSAPYAVQSINATNSQSLGGVDAANYVQTTDPRLSDSRNPNAGSIDYIQNIPGANAQNGSFNINGHGIISGALTTFNATVTNTLSVAGSSTTQGTVTGNIVSANTQFNIGANRVLSIKAGNLLVGDGAGTVTTGDSNTFVGSNAGNANLGGRENTFVGDGAGLLNETGTSNVFVGRQAGQSNQANNFGVFVGSAAGGNSTGDENTFLGAVSGISNIAGNHNTLVGARANVSSGSLTYATAVGAGAIVSNSNSVVLGRTVDTVRVPGALNTASLNVTGGLNVNGTNAVTRILTATATNSISIPANDSTFFTISVPNAQIGDSVSLGLPSNADSRLIYNAFVSLNGTVTVRIFNFSTGLVTLSNQTVRVTVIGF